MQARPGHILVVDDDELNRSLLIKNLEHAGHRTSAAENGFAAFQGLDTDPPDVVLLDIEMPGIDGIEVLERMKADATLRHIPVIMISGVDDTDAIVRCLGAGADDFLPKPFDPAILRARIDAGLNRSRLRTLEQDRVRDVFTRFLPEQIAAEMLAASDGQPLIRAVRLWATVMFVDLRGFTRFADDAPVEQVIAVLARYQSTMGDCVLDHGGTLVDYLGDGLMAAFGAPVESVDHADRALGDGDRHDDRAARRLQRLAPRRRHRRWVRDGDRAELRSRDVGHPRLGAPLRLRRDRRHGEHRRPDRAAHEADRQLGAGRGSDEDEHDGSDRRPPLRRRVRYPRQAGADQAVDHRRRRRVTDARSDLVQSALYRIAETASAAQDMQEFYADIHRIVGELMYADNFYIVLYDEERKTLNWAYGVDEAGDTFPDPNVWEPMGTGEARGLTAYVLRTGEPLFADVRRDRAARAPRRRSSSSGIPSVDWLGVPLRSDGKTVGAMVVQSYSEDDPPHRARQGALDLRRQPHRLGAQPRSRDRGDAPAQRRARA